MFLEIADVLNADELQRLHEIARAARFVDGRISNPHNQAKNNLQVDPRDTAASESSRIVGQALQRNADFARFAFPVRVASPLLCRYEPGMSYGRHPDAAFLPMQPMPLRSDVSCTVFIADPASYEGGELCIHLGSRPVQVKGAAGAAVVYPSTTIHEVMPVRSGQRLVAITFVQSQIVDERYRDLLYTLNEVAALEGLSMKWENRVRLEHVRQSLHRMWSG
ncbi:MAG TPA: Fe2+-dependent dioxygenase [Steroidobacteraceae bacterium]|nr:Fe2+-dependent dioxygenase [Steroidobacteraceae bacterium]